MLVPTDDAQIEQLLSQSRALKTQGRQHRQNLLFNISKSPGSRALIPERNSGNVAAAPIGDCTSAGFMLSP